MFKFPQVKFSEGNQPLIRFMFALPKRRSKVFPILTGDIQEVSVDRIIRRFDSIKARRAFVLAL